MGMYDTVHLKCPHCDQLTAEQTKSGDCSLNDYTLEDAPLGVVEGILGPIFCTKCSKDFEVVMEVKPVFKIVKPGWFGSCNLCGGALGRSRECFCDD